MTATNQERFMLDEAEQAQRRLGDELIAAARETVAAWHQFWWTPPPARTAAQPVRLRVAIDRLEELVGRP